MPTNTEQLRDAPDSRLLDVIAQVQERATQTQSEAYHMLTADVHPGIAPGDVLEVRCAPAAAIEVDEDAQLPVPGEAWHGWLLRQGDQLYRCHGEYVQTLTGQPSDDTKAEVDADPTLTLVPSAPEEPGVWRVQRFSWVAVKPSYRDRTLADGDDVQLRIFPGAAGEQAGTVTIHPAMAAGLEGRPKEN